MFQHLPLALLTCGLVADSQKLLAPALSSGAEFGSAAAAGGTYFAVGAHLDHNETGAVVIYNYTHSVGFSFRPIDLSVGAGFGCALSIASGVLAVGAENDGGKHSQHGSVYLFSLSSAPVQLAKFLPEAPRDGGSFGGALALNSHASAVAVGATNGAGIGNAYLFTRAKDWGDSSQTQTIEITAPADLAPGDNFGQAIALHTTTSANSHFVVVGANHGHNSTGLALTYDVDNLGRVQRGATLQADDGAPGAYFGSSLAVAESPQGCVVVAVGAPWAGRGTVYLFSRRSSSTPGAPTAWSQTKISAPAAVSDAAGFGITVAVSSRSDQEFFDLAIGAWMDAATGTVYSYNAVCDSAGVASAVEVRHLRPPSDDRDTAFFGSAVAMSGSRLVVGADGSHKSDGAAFVFQGHSNTFVI